MEVKISLIMPNLNGAKTIKEAILSAVNNKYHNKELIIIDGKSTDESHNIIQEYAKKYNFIKWINVKDNGISDAINIGLDEANGDIIGYLGSDDLLNTETLFKINATKLVVDFDAIYFDSYTYYTSYNIIQLRKCPNVAFNRENLIKYGTLVGLQNIFFSRKIFNKIRYDINNKYSMDYEIYFRILGGGILILFIMSIQQQLINLIIILATKWFVSNYVRRILFY
ncbi:glycosyltransferase [Campylobacter hyointestinalis]|uniref:glycosyltransferase n=1 Tax=Campylobacter hyointestinalis TaxID=198 RepID=UPI000DCD188B|nr:glycosyltransferase [Campylobacter hyointestinalis]RAZ60441.1 hypothetical protein CHL10071_05855 [Campylobacter hyointestinalis subsp. lawsonii]